MQPLSTSPRYNIHVLYFDYEKRVNARIGDGLRFERCFDLQLSEQQICYIYYPYINIIVFLQYKLFVLYKNLHYRSR